MQPGRALTVSASAVTDAELDQIDRRRKAFGRTPLRPSVPLIVNKLVGVACSGGGMRAAAFSIGAMQALADLTWIPGVRSFFERIDYLSSVSGGSWATCSLASAVSDGVSRAPFSSAKTQGDRDYVGQIARRAKLLNSRGWLDYVEIAGLWLYSFTTGLMILSPFLLAAAATFLLIIPDYETLDRYAIGALSFEKTLFTLLVIFYIAFVATYSGPWLRKIGLVLGKYWPYYAMCIVLLFFLLNQPRIVESTFPKGRIFNFYSIYHFGPPVFQEIILLGLVLVTCTFLLIVLLLRQMQYGRKNPRSFPNVARTVLINLLLLTNMLLVPLFLWGLVVMLIRWGLYYPNTQCPPDFEVCGLNNHHFAPAWMTAAIRTVQCWIWSCTETTVVDSKSFAIVYAALAAALFAFTKLVLDTNWTSLHRFYRDRLNNSFIFRSAEKPTSSPLLSKQGTKSGMPYLLVNCTANVGSSAQQRLTEPFVIAPRYSGSPAVGFTATPIFEDASGEPFDLSTIAAISGAAISPVMGRFTNKSFRMLMSLLAFRLGYWVPNPLMLAKRQQGKDASKSRPMPGRQVGSFYYLREMLGLMSTKSDFIYLTDGGHTDNSGIYELLRRNCSTIIAIDAEADPELLFDNISYLIQLAQVQLNTQILLSAKRVAVDEGVHSAVGLITYPPSQDGAAATHGILLYCKSSVVGDENLELICRKKASGEFPYHSTLNQNYDELLFDAYRSLGYHIVSGLLEGRHRAEFWDGSLRCLTQTEIANVFAEK